MALQSLLLLCFDLEPGLSCKVEGWVAKEHSVFCRIAAGSVEGRCVFVQILVFGKSALILASDLAS